MSPRKAATPEGAVLTSVLGYLSAVRVLAFRMNTGVARFGQRFVRFGVPGMADILAFPKGRVLWIECKAGTKQSYEQQIFEQVVKPEGHGYIVAHSIDDVEAWLRENGL